MMVGQKNKDINDYLKIKDNMKLENSSSVECSKLNGNETYKCTQNIVIRVRGVFKNSIVLNKLIKDMRKISVDAQTVQFSLSMGTQDLYKSYLINSAVFKSLKSARKTAASLKQDIVGVKEAYYVTS